MNIKVKGTDIVKEITATAFYKLCRGSKLIKIDNIPSPALYESTVFTYKTPTDEEVYKIETRSLKPFGKTTIAYYKQA